MPPHVTGHGIRPKPFPQVRPGTTKGPRHEPEPPTKQTGSAAERIINPPVRVVPLPVDALRIDVEQNLDAVPRLHSHVGSGYASVEPQRHAPMPQVVRSPRQQGDDLCGSERQGANLGPHVAVRGRPDDAAPFRLGLSS